jgi:hypothetical protein
MLSALLFERDSFETQERELNSLYGKHVEKKTQIICPLYYGYPRRGPTKMPKYLQWSVEAEEETSGDSLKMKARADKDA